VVFSKSLLLNMMELCDLLQAEASAAVRAVLGHFMLVYFTHILMAMTD
jgi:hypothetical protein